MVKRVIITGATGFIGSALTKKLLDNDVVVYGVDINNDSFAQFSSYEKFKPVTASFADYDKLSELIKDYHIDAFFHFAWAGGLTTALNNYEVQIENIRGALLAAEEAKKIECRKFIFISSNYQFMELKTNKDINPSIYGIAKKTAQDMCRTLLENSSTHFIGAILGNTFGEGDYSNKAVNTFIRKMLNDEPLQLVSYDSLNDWMYIDETIAGLAYLADNNTDCIVYIGHKDISTFGYKICLLRELIGSSSQLNFGVYPENSFVNYDKVLNYCIEQKVLNSRPIKDYFCNAISWIKKIDKRQ